jgi:hypothetical protein
MKPIGGFHHQVCESQLSNIVDSSANQNQRVSSAVLSKSVDIAQGLSYFFCCYSYASSSACKWPTCRRDLSLRGQGRPYMYDCTYCSPPPFLSLPGVALRGTICSSTAAMLKTVLCLIRPRARFVVPICVGSPQSEGHIFAVLSHLAHKYIQNCILPEFDGTQVESSSRSLLESKADLSRSILYYI